MSRSLEKDKLTLGRQFDALPSLSICYFFVELFHVTLRTHSLPLLTGLKTNLQTDNVKVRCSSKGKNSKGKKLNVTFFCMS